ncbi:MAG: 2-octaprenyl-6-methoxyphenyl hydroxylase [Gammaproteobacteria bacterium]|nr:MAG: 2-octaprenyl-6-methoxyphenyl hydroxylase [Gammaproteobacteria bacterium]
MKHYTSEKLDYDIIIVGGGLVGAGLACALGELSSGDDKLRIAIVEAIPFRDAAQPSYDDRNIALSQASYRIFSTLGLWPDIIKAATPIESIYISNRGHFGAARLHAKDHGVDALGFVAQTRAIGEAFKQRIQNLNNVELICPASITALDINDDHANVTIAQDNHDITLSCALVIGADGAKSKTRELLGIASQQHDHGQTAIVANVTPEKPHNNAAYERFTDSGPLALLPMSEQRCALVYTVWHQQVEEILNLSDEEFLERLSTRFGDRLGRLVKVGKRSSYPLALNKAERTLDKRAVLIGNAAHSLHPVAGQGFNLGVRDIAVLAETINDALKRNLDIGNETSLNTFQQWRRNDQQRIISFTEGLVSIFSNPLASVKLLRNIGLVGVDLLPPVKRLLARQTMGIAGKQPRLARGIPLR